MKLFKASSAQALNAFYRAILRFSKEWTAAASATSNGGIAVNFSEIGGSLEEWGMSIWNLLSFTFPVKSLPGWEEFFNVKCSKDTQSSKSPSFSLSWINFRKEDSHSFVSLQIKWPGLRMLLRTLALLWDLAFILYTVSLPWTILPRFFFIPS